MNLNFQQGIVTYPSVGSTQSFLAYNVGYVSLLTANGHTDVTFTYGNENYLLSESSDVPNAWGPLTAGTDCWLYWDINLRTGVRTFGFTPLAPVYSANQPASPAEGQHWFDLNARKMKVYTSGAFRDVLRVFAAKVFNGTFTTQAMPGFATPGKPFAGSQAGLTSPDIRAGRIIFDNEGKPVRRTDGRFFTTENEMFVQGSPVNTVRLESTILTGTARENMAKYLVVKFSEFGEVNLAQYNDTQQTAIAMLMEDLNVGETGELCAQGVVTNPDWSWSTVGAPLWVSESGELTETDPHVANALVYPIGRSPVGRVISPTSIIFDQGLGGKGDPGDGGEGTAVVPLASASVYGISRLSVAPVDGQDPIVVGTNDPRNSDARVPLAHTQAASTILPTPYGSLTGGNLQLVLQQVEDNKLSTTGGTVTGNIVMTGASTKITLPNLPLLGTDAANKTYVDGFVARTGSTMSGSLVMTGPSTQITLPNVPVLPTDAVNKAYVDSISGGGTTVVDPLEIAFGQSTTGEITSSPTLRFDPTIALVTLGTPSTFGGTIKAYPEQLLRLAGGDGSNDATGYGGMVVLRGGDSPVNGGGVTIRGGNGLDGIGGDVSIDSGRSDSPTDELVQSGSIRLRARTHATTPSYGTNGRITLQIENSTDPDAPKSVDAAVMRINEYGAVGFGYDDTSGIRGDDTRVQYGNSGEVLVSQGPNRTPIWAPAVPAFQTQIIQANTIDYANLDGSDAIDFLVSDTVSLTNPFVTYDGGTHTFTFARNGYFRFRFQATMTPNIATPALPESAIAYGIHTITTGFIGSSLISPERSVRTRMGAMVDGNTYGNTSLLNVLSPTLSGTTWNDEIIIAAIQDETVQFACYGYNFNDSTFSVAFEYVLTIDQIADYNPA